MKAAFLKVIIIKLQVGTVSIRYEFKVHNCERSLRDEILIPMLLEMFRHHQDILVFQQDQHSPHTTGISMEFLNVLNLARMQYNFLQSINYRISDQITVTPNRKS